VAASIGRPLDIPIIIRTLGQVLYQDGLKLIRFSFGPDIVTFLEGGAAMGAGAGVPDPGMQVTDFWRPWWLANSAPKAADYVTMATISSALAHHLRAIRALPGQTPVPPPKDESPELNKPAYGWHSDVVVDQASPCTRCRLYRAVALGAFDQLRDLRNLVHACETLNLGERDLAARRASGFNQLYEATVIKEANADLADADRLAGKDLKKTWSAGADAVRKKYLELIAIEVHMPSPKWTWGVELTSADLQELARGADRNYEVPHTGYDASLATGHFSGEESDVHCPGEIESDPDREFLVDELSADFPVVRDLEPLEFPLSYASPFLLPRSREVLTEPPSSGSGSGMFVMPGAGVDKGKGKMLDSGSEYMSEDAPRKVIKKKGKKGKGKERAEVSKPTPWLRLPPQNYVLPPMTMAMTTPQNQLPPALRSTPQEYPTPVHPAPASTAFPPASGSTAFPPASGSTAFPPASPAYPTFLPASASAYIVPPGMMIPASDSDFLIPGTEKAVKDLIKKILYPSAMEAGAAKEAGAPSGQNMLEAILISSDEESPASDHAMEVSGSEDELMPGSETQEQVNFLPMTLDIDDSDVEDTYELETRLPMTLVMSDSDDDEEEEEDEDDDEEDRSPRVGSSGPYTAASFSKFQNDWVN
jgi:hypothetical protein